MKIQTFLEVAKSISKLSKDPNTKVGAVILRPDFSVVSVGYNGFPPGFPDDISTWQNRDLKNKLVIHAEDNALDYSNGQDLSNCSIICTHYPCTRCAAKIIKKKIKFVYFLNDKRKDHDSDIVDWMFSISNISAIKLEET